MKICLKQAPKDYTLELAFIGNFGIFCRSSACFHWVEIKYKKDLGLEGARWAQRMILAQSFSHFVLKDGISPTKQCEWKLRENKSVHAAVQTWVLSSAMQFDSLCAYWTAIVIFQRLMSHLKAKRRAPAYSRVLHRFREDVYLNGCPRSFRGQMRQSRPSC